MLRTNVPDASDPLGHIINGFGNSALLTARSQFLNALYFGSGSSLTPREREAIRMPVAKNIGCHTCMSTRLWRDLPGFSDEIDEEFYTHAMDLDFGWSGFSARERFLLELTARFEDDYGSLNGDDNLWDAAHALFAEDELGDAFITLSTFVGLGHSVIVLGAGNACDVPDLTGLRELAQSIGGGQLPSLA